MLEEGLDETRDPVLPPVEVGTRPDAVTAWQDAPDIEVASQRVARTGRADPTRLGRHGSGRPTGAAAVLVGFGAACAGVFSTMINYTWWPTSGDGYLLPVLAYAVALGLLGGVALGPRVASSITSQAEERLAELER